ncbi:hypothetical protein FisN_1Lh169 [Fistulifera solaris]|uniref:Elongator complex protein 5 n=1 Tax=Fistulifera solaris TaxID=1519565 RepID=A0A1Z5K505_FISSO|nr:hypothetical protein FisN_1Lh169 [Fistulifera solaris]|eukprot:GAX21333.1 hypothetical protein FisN_1Lh169 [Fistulifera solaris]
MLGSATTPLEDIFPSAASTILVTDSVEQEGRFILQSWISQQSSVLWLSGGPPPVGHKLTSSFRCIPAEIAESLEQAFDAETFTKLLFRQIKEWVAQQLQQQQQQQQQQQRRHPTPSDQPWIILDDVSVLSTLLGPRLIYALILSLQAERFKLMIRCSQETSERDKDEPTTWIGAGGVMEHPSPKPVWETTLVELADYIVDVLPLQSGYTREAQGRIVLSENVGLRTMKGYNFIMRDGKPVVTLV